MFIIQLVRELHSYRFLMVEIKNYKISFNLVIFSVDSFDKNPLLFNKISR
jgi:hypothetical protein